MTEAEWNACGDPQKMVWVLNGMKVTRTRVGKRKLRLFACACCRLFWDMLSEPLFRDCLVLAERFAEGQASKQELQKAYERARECEWQTRPPNLKGTAIYMTVHAAQSNAFAAAFDMTICEDTLKEPRASALCGLLRDILGPLPFRPIALDPSCLTPTVKQLAEAIYQERAFDRLPVLADALEEGGCDDPNILNHCRQPSEHVRGCWALDFVLGKE